MAEITEQQIIQIAEKAVETYMVKMGIDSEDPRDMQSDMIFVRKLRQLCENVGTKMMMVIISVLTVGLLGGVWLAIRKALGLC
ncbi:MAG: hypothetical protein KAS32_11200 [Candidatus Peribacteraceae bacterium]|nr:hypothetical protein [Candidatus Peribacteraceae bacterium]